MNYHPGPKYTYEDRYISVDSMYDKIDSSELHISQGDTERALLKAAGVAPGKENRTELLRAQVPVAVLVQQAVEHLNLYF